MKKLVMVLIAIFLSGMVLQSCGSSKNCPAYDSVREDGAKKAKRY